MNQGNTGGRICERICYPIVRIGHLLIYRDNSGLLESFAGVAHCTITSINSVADSASALNVKVMLLSEPVLM